MSTAAAQLARSAESHILRAIRQYTHQHGRGPTQTELHQLTGLSTVVMQGAIRRLLAVGLVSYGVGGRLRAALDPDQSVPWTKLSPEELERVRRGEPSTGRPPMAVALPATAPVQQAPPPVTIDLSRPRRSRVSDQDILLAYRSYPTRRDAARSLGLSPTALTLRLQKLGIGRGRPGPQPKVDAERLRATLASSASLGEAARRLGVSLNLLWRRRRELNMGRARMGRPRVVSDEQIRQALLAHRSLKRAAIALGVSPTTVWKWARAMGLSVRKIRGMGGAEGGHQTDISCQSQTPTCSEGSRGTPGLGAN